MVGPRFRPHIAYPSPTLTDVQTSACAGMFCLAPLIHYVGSEEDSSEAVVTFGAESIEPVSVPTRIPPKQGPKVSCVGSVKRGIRWSVLRSGETAS